MALYQDKVDNSPAPTGVVNAADMNALKQEILLRAFSSDVAALATVVGGKADSATVAAGLAGKADSAATAAALANKADTSFVTSGLANKADTATVNAALGLKLDTNQLLQQLRLQLALGGNKILMTNPDDTGFIGVSYAPATFATPGDIADGVDTGALSYRIASVRFWGKESVLSPAAEAAINYAGAIPAHSLFPVMQAVDSSAILIGWADNIRAGLAQGHVSGVVKVVNSGGGARNVTFGTTTGGAVVTVAPGVAVLGLGSTAGNELHVWYEITGANAVRLIKFEQR